LERDLPDNLSERVKTSPTSNRGALFLKGLGKTGGLIFVSDAAQGV
jgi:hypothetical protein